MTGYASVQCAAPNSAGTTIGIELRAVNSRFLDITFKMPDEWRAVELPMRQLLGRHVQRGKLELRGFCRLDQGPRAPDSAQLQQLLLLQQQVQRQKHPIFLQVILKVLKLPERISLIIRLLFFLNQPF